MGWADERPSHPNSVFLVAAAGCLKKLADMNSRWYRYILFSRHSLIFLGIETLAMGVVFFAYLFTAGGPAEERRGGKTIYAVSGFR